MADFLFFRRLKSSGLVLLLLFVGHRANAYTYDQNHMLTTIISITNMTDYNTTVDYTTVQYSASTKEADHDFTVHDNVPLPSHTTTSIMLTYFLCHTPTDQDLSFLITIDLPKTSSQKILQAQGSVLSDGSIALKTSNSEPYSSPTPFVCQFSSYNETKYLGFQPCANAWWDTYEEKHTNYYALVDGAETPYKNYIFTWDKITTSLENGQLLAHKLVSLLKSNNNLAGNNYTSFTGSYDKNNSQIRLVATSAEVAAKNPYSQVTNDTQCASIMS